MDPSKNKRALELARQKANWKVITPCDTDMSSSKRTPRKRYFCQISGTSFNDNSSYKHLNSYCCRCFLHEALKEVSPEEQIENLDRRFEQFHFQGTSQCMQMEVEVEGDMLEEEQEQPESEGCQQVQEEEDED